MPVCARGVRRPGAQATTCRHRADQREFQPSRGIGRQARCAREHHGGTRTMKTVFLITLFAAATPCIAATDADLSQKSSAQVRAIATGLRRDVAAGRVNLQKAEKQINALDAYSREQWQRAENERKNAAKWRRRVLAGFAAGALGGAVATALALRSQGTARPAEVTVRKVRVRRTTAGRKK